MINRFLIATLTIGTILGFASSAWSQRSIHYIGRAVGGQSLSIDLNSINPVSRRSVDFVYYLGEDERYSQANCEEGTWTTFEDGEVRRPQSPATAEMLRIVCNGGQVTESEPPSASSNWAVFNPPSNVRVQPNGAVQCVVRSLRTINVYDFEGEWAITDVCGTRGYIHISQIESVD